MIKIIDNKKLIELYKIGYFPMAENNKEEDIYFYKPHKRFVIPINSFHIPKKLFQDYKKHEFEYRINSQFQSVIDNCAKPRKKGKDTWINQMIRDTYIELFMEGYAKSIECFYKGKLVGGLYGVHIGACFFGESMYSVITNTSKYCLLFLISILKKNNFNLLDSQFYNKHLVQFGAYEISNAEYQLQLKKGISKECKFPTNFNFQKSISVLHSFNHKS